MELAEKITFAYFPLSLQMKKKTTGDHSFQKYKIFSESHFLPPDMHTHLCVSRDKKY